MKKYFILYISLLIFLSNYISAQSNSEAFESFSIGIDLLANVNSNQFHEYWDSKYGVEGFFSAPFYFGYIQLGASYMSFTGKSSSQPNFKSYLFYLQWGYKFVLISNFDLFINALIGIYQMNFDESSTVVSPGQLTEREFSAGLSTSLTYSISNSWRININARYIRIFTHTQINLIFISAGITKSFSSPDWLKDFLR